MRKLSILLTTIALSCAGFASSPANAAVDEITCSKGGSFLVENGVVGKGNLYDGNCMGTAIIPENATSIATNAFRDAGELETVSFAGNSQVETIGDSAFTGAAALESIVLPNSVTTIEGAAFWGTAALKSIAIPKDVATIAENAFRFSGVNSFQIASGNNFYTSSGNVLFNKTKTRLIYFPATQTNEYVVPNGVTSIAPFAFQDRLIDNISVPRLLKITLPSGLLGIGDHAFANATALSSLEIPDSVTGIGIYAFAASGIERITIPSGVASIDDNAFAFSEISKFYFLRGASPYPANTDLFPFTQLTTEIVPKIFVPTGASNYGAIGNTWKGLTIDIGYRATFLGNGSTSGTTPQQIMREYSGTYSVPGNSGGLKKTGHTFAGWNTLADGKGTNVVIGSNSAMPAQDFNLYAKWIKNAEATVKPSISGTATSTASGKNKLTAAKGTWTGQTPGYAYQWYSCSTQVKAATQTIPKTCKAIPKATTNKLAVIKAFKGKYLAVAVKGTVAGTPATQWLSKSTGKVK